MFFLLPASLLYFPRSLTASQIPHSIFRKRKKTPTKPIYSLTPKVLRDSYGPVIHSNLTGTTKEAHKQKKNQGDSSVPKDPEELYKEKIADRHDKMSGVDVEQALESLEAVWPCKLGNITVEGSNVCGIDLLPKLDQACVVYNADKYGTSDFEQYIRTIAPNCVIRSFTVPVKEGVMYTSTTRYSVTAAGLDNARRSSLKHFATHYHDDHIDILRLKLLGFEWHALMQDTMKDDNNWPVIHEIIVQVMLGGKIPYWQNAMGEANRAAALEKFVLRLEERGFRLYDKRNVNSDCCVELAFIHKDWGAVQQVS